MAGYIGSKASVVSSGAERKKVFNITTSTTALTGLSYTANQVHVFHNGVRLISGTDYTETNDTTITLTNAAENGDQVVVVSYASFQTSDTVSASAGGTFANSIDVTGTVTSDGLTVDTIQVNGVSNSFPADTGNGQILTTGNGGSAPFNESGSLVYRPRQNDTDGRGNHYFYTGATPKLRQNIAPNGDIGFYEDTGTTAKFFWDASAESLGIGTSSPVAPLDIFTSSGTEAKLVVRNDTTSSPVASIELRRGSTSETFGADAYGDYRFKNESGILVFDYGENGTTTERFRIDASGNLYAQGIYDNTTSGGGNVRVQSNGLMQRDTSSLRYKNSVQDATHGLSEVLALRPVTYKGNNDGDTVFGGLIAEEVHAVGLTEFVDYDDQDRPDALQYANMVSLCIKAIQEQQATITALEARITALEAV